VTALDPCIRIFDHFSHTCREATWPHGLKTCVGRELWHIAGSKANAIGTKAPVFLHRGHGLELCSDGLNTGRGDERLKGDDEENGERREEERRGRKEESKEARADGEEKEKRRRLQDSTCPAMTCDIHAHGRRRGRRMTSAPPPHDHSCWSGCA
jgi:hypothetical protein